MALAGIPLGALCSCGAQPSTASARLVLRTGQEARAASFAALLSAREACL